MKTLRIIITVILFSACSSFAQTPGTPAAPPTPDKEKREALKQAMEQNKAHPGMPVTAGVPTRLNRYMVTIPHTKEECQKVQSEMKEKGGSLAMRFDWGCASGEHVGYSLMGGLNVDSVRKQLPEGLQTMAKITKVDKLGAAQMEQMHK